MEDIPQQITRLRTELAQARATRDRIEKTGMSSSFGGVAFTNAAYESVLLRIARLERTLFDAEAIGDGLEVSSSVRLVRINSTL